MKSVAIESGYFIQLVVKIVFSPQMLHSDKNVQDRGLVVVDPKAKDIIVEHRSYCSKKMKERHFSGDVLGYVTPVSSYKE